MAGSSSERWLQPVVEILTVGLPFCAFKLLTGVVVSRSETLQPLGYLLIVLGAIDLALNTANLLSWVVAHRRVSSVCLVELVLRRFGTRAELGLAIDVFLSFGLVALVIGLSWIPRIPGTALPLWNLAVVLNVLGAGVGRLYAALRPDEMTRASDQDWKASGREV